MVKNLKKYKKQLEKEGRLEELEEYTFFPPTFNMPGEYTLFVEEYKKWPGSVWIMKPIGAA